MPTTIQYAQLEDRIVGLVDVERGQQGLTCITCGDRLIVKDGRELEPKRTPAAGRSERSTSPIPQTASAMERVQPTTGSRWESPSQSAWR